MPVRPRSVANSRVACLALGAAIACASTLAACKSGGSGGSSGGSPTGPGGTGSTATCRTAAKDFSSLQTFLTGQTVSATGSCTANAAGTEVVCASAFTDSVGGPGTITQTSRFDSKADLVDEAATNPPLARSQSTTTVTASGGLSLTSVATNTYDSQKRLASTTIVSPPLATITTTYSAWDSSGRPTSGSSTLNGAVTITYDNANRTVTRVIPPNTCKVTHDANGILIKEECTGTTPSTTNVTVISTQTICK